MYTRHKPYLVEVLENLIRGKLKEPQYPYAGDFKLADRLAKLEAGRKMVKRVLNRINQLNGLYSNDRVMLENQGSIFNRI